MPLSPALSPAYEHVRAPAPGFALSRPAITLLAALWLVALDNFALWRTVFKAVGGIRADNAVFLLSLPLLLTAWVFLVLALLSWGRASKPVLVVVLLLSAVAGYFTCTFGTLLDSAMIENIVQTYRAEALDLLSWRLGAWILVFGVLPSIALARLPVASTSWARELGVKALGMAAAAACVGIVLLGQYQHYASLVRNHRELRFMLVPHNIAAAVHGYVKRSLSAPLSLQTVGIDAAVAAPAGKPALAVLVIGETARAQNFSLNGYGRPTNPELARQGVVSFTDVRACGTSTAVSLPCMFLDVGRSGFDGAPARQREGLLDVLQHAGIAVRWRDNNSGCKGVCDRVPHEDMRNAQSSGLCQDGECYDEVLLNGLQEYIDTLDRDAVIVLHMMGSHGPAYFRRYPPAFEIFAPVCDKTELDRCSPQSIVNAYDNTLLYTDHVLSRTIDVLRKSASRFDTALLYVSDHGESLGENGLYLHGIPYALAPREQVQVPMVLWLSEGMLRSRRVDAACLEARERGLPHSHDNVFHSVVGLLNVRTSAYRRELDLFHRCRA
jgi:lipid A ethanolaminephosphotransferase